MSHDDMLTTPITPGNIQTAAEPCASHTRDSRSTGKSLGQSKQPQQHAMDLLV